MMHEDDLKAEGLRDGTAGIVEATVVLVRRRAVGGRSKRSRTPPLAAEVTVLPQSIVG